MHWKNVFFYLAFNLWSQPWLINCYIALSTWHSKVNRDGGYIPSNHDIAGEQLGYAGTPIPEHSKLGTVTVEETQGGPHQVTQLHPPGAVLNGRGLFTSEEEPLKHRGGIVEVPRSKPGGEKDENWSEWMQPAEILNTVHASVCRECRRNQLPLTPARPDWRRGVCWGPHTGARGGHGWSCRQLWPSLRCAPTGPRPAAAGVEQSAKYNPSPTAAGPHTPEYTACPAGSISEERSHGKGPSRNIDWVTQKPHT